MTETKIIESAIRKVYSRNKLENNNSNSYQNRFIYVHLNTIYVQYVF